MSKGKNQPVLNFKPSAGIIIVDPIKKTEKSTMVAVNDSVDDPHRGVVVAVGEKKPFDSNPEFFANTNVSIGDVILYSIVGCERTRLEYGGDLRHEFVVVPFNRVLGIIK